MEVWAWVQANWASIVALLWTIDQLLKIISKLTPTTVDDNLSDMLGNFLARFLQKK